MRDSHAAIHISNAIPLQAYYTSMLIDKEKPDQSFNLMAVKKF